MAGDVCRILGLENVSKALIELDHRDKREITGSKVGSDTSKLRIINESGVYTLVFKSRNKEALEYQRWDPRGPAPDPQDRWVHPGQ